MKFTTTAVALLSLAASAVGLTTGRPGTNQVPELHKWNHNDTKLEARTKNQFVTLTSYMADHCNEGAYHISTEIHDTQPQCLSVNGVRAFQVNEPFDGWLGPAATCGQVLLQFFEEGYCAAGKESWRLILPNRGCMRVTDTGAKAALAKCI